MLNIKGFVFLFFLNVLSPVCGGGCNRKMKCFVLYLREDHGCRVRITGATGVVSHVEWMKLFVGVARSEGSFVIVHKSLCCDAIGCPFVN